MREILAPAGNKNSALAAINAGTDAIYLGLNKFSARYGAENFDGQSFKEICNYAHAFGVKVYAALNTVVKDDELDAFFDSVKNAWNDGVDALIMQDMYLGAFIKKSFPQIVLHLSTQAGCCNPLGAELAKEHGFDRVILARETKLKDVEKICSIIETEVFVQGALCTCFSGQCYMSSFAGGNSGNRGRCKQPCRKRYRIDRDGYDDAAYRLSLSDLCVGENIDKLIEAGVSSFKIEGRMRRAEYVAAAVGYYNELLNRFDENGRRAPDGGSKNRGERLLSELKRTYNRGNYTGGLAFGQDKTLISSSVQGHIGEYVGTIEVKNSKFICKSGSVFGAGDGFKILRGGKEAGGGTFGGKINGGFIINSRDRLKNGDKVFITTDARLNAKLSSQKRLIPVTLKADFFAGNKAEISVNGKKYYSELPLATAQTRPLSREEIINCFMKVDNYPFAPSFESVETDGVFMAASQLNALRRFVYENYFKEISHSRNREIEGSFEYRPFIAGKNGKTAVICSDLRGIKADIGILKPDNYEKTDLCGQFDGEKYLYVPPYLSGDEIEIIGRAAESFDGIYCDGYFGAGLAKALGKRFFAGTGFNITNGVSAGSCKADRICLSKELTAAEAERLSAENTFYLTAGNIKVMDLIYCPFGKKCATCDRRTRYTLTDDDNRRFPLRRYNISECRFEVYNCADLVSVNANGSRCGRLYDLSLENGATVLKELEKGTEPKKIFENYTRGHSNSRIL